MHDDETFRVEDDYAPRRRSTGVWIAVGIIGVVVGGIVGLIGCCGGLAYVGVSMQKEEIVEDLRENPVLQEHVGNVRTSSVVWIASLDAPDDEFVIDVTGTNGAGQLRVATVTGDDGSLNVVSGTIEAPDGTRHDLFPQDAESDSE